MKKCYIYQFVSLKESYFLFYLSFTEICPIKESNLVPNGSLTIARSLIGCDKL